MVFKSSTTHIHKSKSILILSKHQQQQQNQTQFFFLNSIDDEWKNVRIVLFCYFLYLIESILWLFSIYWLSWLLSSWLSFTCDLDCNWKQPKTMQPKIFICIRLIDMCMLCVCMFVCAVVYYFILFSFISFFFWEFGQFVGVHLIALSVCCAKWFIVFVYTLIHVHQNNNSSKTSR